MFKFPENLYTDVRIEDVFEAATKVQNDSLKENKQRRYKGALIRIFDGEKWYYSSITNVDEINEEIENLSKMATPNPKIYEHPTVKRLEVHEANVMRYEENSVRKLTKSAQEKLLLEYIDTIKQFEEVKEYILLYKAHSVNKSFYSSKGAKLQFDKQTSGLLVRYTLNTNGKRFDDGYDKTTTNVEELKSLQPCVEKAIKRSKAYIEQSVPITPGKYTVVFAPVATGVFAHESFGHKSEADLMLGSETMKAEWAIGKQVGTNQLSIVDRGDIEGAGYTPFDDEGSKARINYLIKEGQLAGRLHTSSTAAELEEGVTGNGRAMHFEFEPIVRMTTTYVSEGNLTKDELFAGVREGIFVEDIAHGSGLTAFTIAPRRAYMIRDGKIAEPVTVAVVTGNVMETLHLIDGISNEVELFSFSGGGCGKMEQYPLPVGFGGPYIRVQNLDVQ